MTVAKFKKWLKDNKVLDDAAIVLQHPGGFDPLKFDSYDPKENVVVIRGTG
jgi:hypothetical protein